MSGDILDHMRLGAAMVKADPSIQKKNLTSNRGWHLRRIRLRTKSKVKFTTSKFISYLSFRVVVSLPDTKERCPN